MTWIWREKPDGSRALGYPVYLAGALAALGLIGVLHRRLASLPAQAAARSSARGAEVRSVTGAAALAAPVPNLARPVSGASRSFRLAPSAAPAAAPGVGAESEPFDAIDATLQPGGTDAQLRRDRSRSDFAALPPALEGEGAPRTTLLGYRDPSADGGGPPPRTAGAPVVLIARGSLLPVCLLTSVDTSNPSAVLQFGLADDVVQHGSCRLRLGTHLLGKLAGRPMRGRLELTVDTVLFPEGTQRPIAATAVEANELGSDLRPGLAATFVPTPAWAHTVPYLSDFATGFLGLLESRAQERLAVGSAGLTLQPSVPNEMQGSASQAGAQAVNDFTRARLREIEDRYAAYYFIPAGTECWMQLDADFVAAAP